MCQSVAVSRRDKSLEEMTQPKYSCCTVKTHTIAVLLTANTKMLTSEEDPVSIICRPIEFGFSRTERNVSETKDITIHA